MSFLGPTVTPTQLRERGWTRTDPRPWSKVRARWEGPDGWRLEHCGHPTANTPWVLIAPDGRWILMGARFAEPPAANLGTAWPDLATATEYVADVRAGARVLPGPEMDREGDQASNPRKPGGRTRRPAGPAKRPAAPSKPTAWPPAGLALLPTVLGRMAWPDVGTYVAWSEETSERRGRQVRHGTAHLSGRVTLVMVNPADARHIDVWAVPDRGEERRVGIAGLFVPEAKVAGFQERAQRVYAAKHEQVQAMLGGGSAYGEAMVASNLRTEDLASAQAWPDDTLGILTQIQEHQGHGPGTKKWGANHEGLPRATIDRLVKEGLVREVFMSGEPVTAKSPRKQFPTLLVTTEAGDAMLAESSPDGGGEGNPAPPPSPTPEQGGTHTQAAWNAAQREQAGSKPAPKRQKAAKAPKKAPRRDPKLAKLLAQFDADRLVKERNGIRIDDSVRRGRGKEIGRVVEFIEPKPGWYRARIRWADTEQYVDVSELVPAKGPPAGRAPRVESAAGTAEVRPVARPQGPARTLLSLFDYSGEWSRPFGEAGWNVLQVDLKHGDDIRQFSAKWLLENVLQGYDVIDGILAAPPCTDFTVTAARHWPKQDDSGSTACSVELVRQALRTIDFLKPAFWAIENPAGRIATLVPGVGGRTMVWDPCDFAGWTFPSGEDLARLDELRNKNLHTGDKFSADDIALVKRTNAYTKRTVLYGNFNMPEMRGIVPVNTSKWGSWLQSLGGKSEKTKELRSITPAGFARAFYEANKDREYVEEEDRMQEVKPAPKRVASKPVGARASVSAKPEPSRPPGPGAAGPIPAVHEVTAKPPERRTAPRVLGQRHATMAENVNRWASHVESQVNRLTPTDRAKFYQVHAAETLRTAIRAAEINNVPDAERETVARKALASHPALRPFVDHLPPVGSTKRNVPVVLIACADTKVDAHGEQVPAGDLYASALFRKSLAYARAITTEDNIWILSALHGAIRTDTRIGTYDVAMKDLRVREREDWRDRARATIVGALGQVRPRHVIQLGGEDYRVPLPWPVEEPLKGKSIGPRLRWLNEQLAALGAAETAATAVEPRRRARIRMATRGHPWREVEALAWDEDFFVNEDVEDPDILRVTHAPTGSMWQREFPDLASAMGFVGALNHPSIRPTVDRLIRANRDKDPELPAIGERLRGLLERHLGPPATAPPDAPPPSQTVIGTGDTPPRPSPRVSWGSVLGRPLQPHDVASPPPPSPHVLWGSVLGRSLQPGVAS